MITWKLWQTINNPPTLHPLYKYAARTRFTLDRQGIGSRIILVYLVFCCGLAFLWPLILRWLPLAILFLLVMGNTLYSLLWTINISGIITRERDANTYDLLCLSPDGALVVSWALSTGYIHRSQLFVWVYFLVRLLSMIAIITLAIALVLPALTLANGDAPTTNEVLFDTLLYGLGLAIAFFFDHIYSVVLAGLIGIVIPVTHSGTSESRLRAAAVFLGLQALGYTVAGFIGLLVLPALYALLHFTGWAAGFSLALFALVSFIGIREFITRALWDRVIQRLNVEASDLDMTRYQVS